MPLEKLTRTKGARRANPERGGLAHDAKYPVVRVRFSSPEEKKTAERNAKACGSRTLASHMKMLAMGHMPPSVLDQSIVGEVAALTGQISKAGGLLKQMVGKLRADKEHPKLAAEISRELEEIKQVRVQTANLMREINKIVK